MKISPLGRRNAMSKVGWLGLILAIAVAAVAVGFFLTGRPGGDGLAGATLEPVGGGASVQGAALLGKPTVLVLFTPT